MPKKRTVQPEGSPQVDEQAVARANIERALTKRRTASADGHVQVYLEKGLRTSAEAEGYLAEIHRQRYGGAT